MSLNGTQQILSHNPYQNATQATLDGFSNNLRYGNIYGMPVTAEEFNTKIGTSQEMALRGVPLAVEAGDEDEPFFGTHLREAASTVRKLFGR